MKHNKKEPFRNRNEFIEYFTRGANSLLEKNELIISLCKDKTVLDLGCIDHSADTAFALGENWLHKQVKDVAKHIIGIDILTEDANLLTYYGYEIINADVENFDLGKTFDVIIAGDLIEHLSNIGLFLECVKKHMDNKTILIITTPNPFNIDQSFSAIFHNWIHVHEQHTVWLSPHNFWEIALKNHLEIVDFFWIKTRFQFNISRKPYKSVINKLSKIIKLKRNICKSDYAIILKKNE